MQPVHDWPRFEIEPSRTSPNYTDYFDTSHLVADQVRDQ